MPPNDIGSNFIIVRTPKCKIDLMQTLTEFDNNVSKSEHFELGPIKIKIVNLSKYFVAEFSGLGEKSPIAKSSAPSHSVSYENFEEKSLSEMLVGRSVKFLFCVRFDVSLSLSENFPKSVAEQFFRVFGSEGVASAILVIEPMSDRINYANIKPVLHKADGYQSMKANNSINADIPFVIWKFTQNFNFLTRLSKKASKLNGFKITNEMWTKCENNILNLNDEIVEIKPKESQKGKKINKILSFYFLFFKSLIL